MIDRPPLNRMLADRMVINDAVRFGLAVLAAECTVRVCSRLYTRIRVTSKLKSSRAVPRSQAIKKGIQPGIVHAIKEHDAMIKEIKERPDAYQAG